MKQILKRWLAGILSVVMVFSLLPVMASAEDAPFLNDGGTGQEGDPYQIATREQLEAFRDYVNAGNNCENQYIKLTADIKLESEEWTPIGGIDNIFQGTFDGGNFTVSGLNVTSGDNVGFFGTIALGGTVKNLGVSGSVSGQNTVGGIAGQNNGIIENCHNAATVTGDDMVGGIAGGIHGARSADYSAEGGDIIYCYNTGIIEGDNTVGGIVGNVGGHVLNCYNTGAVSGSQAGGIAGSWTEGYCVNCYNTGHVEGSDEPFTGGLAGNGGADAFANCFYLEGTAEHGVMFDDTGKKTADEFRTLAETLTNSSLSQYSTSWVDDPLLGRPVLESNREAVIATAEQPFEIPDKETLENFREYVNAGNDCTGMYFELTEDINLEGGPGNQWTPIGWSERDDKLFNGTFDGGHHIVSGLYVSGGTPDYWRGLFGHIGESGTVRDL